MLQPRIAHTAENTPAVEYGNIHLSEAVTGRGHVNSVSTIPDLGVAPFCGPGVSGCVRFGRSRWFRAMGGQRYVGCCVVNGSLKAGQSWWRWWKPPRCDMGIDVSSHNLDFEGRLSSSATGY